MRDKKIIYAPVFVSVIMLLLLISERITDTSVSNGADYYLTLTVVQLIIYMLPLAFYCKSRNIMFFKSLKFNLFSYRNLLLTVCLALIFIIGILLFLFTDLFYFDGLIYASRVTPYLFNSDGNKIYAVLALIIVPSFVNELLFRGVVLSEYRSYGVAWAIIMSSLLFSFSTMSFTDFPKLLYAGAFFGIIGAITDSVIPSVILHMIYNAFAIYFESTVVTYMKRISDSAMPLFVLGVLLLLLLFCTFSLLENIYSKKAEEYDRQSEVIKKLSALERKEKTDTSVKIKVSFSQRMSELLLSPAFLVSFIIFIVTAALKRM